MRNSGNNPITNIVHIDEFVLEGREKEKVGRQVDTRDNSKKKKAINAVELTEDGKVKRMCATRI